MVAGVAAPQKRRDVLPISGAATNLSLQETGSKEPTFQRLVGSREGKKCIIIGEGPSADLLTDENIKGYCLIGVNRTKLLGFQLDYWMANDIIPNIIENTPKQQWFIYETVNYKNPNWVIKNGKIRSGITMVRALSAAYQLGFGEILMAGCDLGKSEDGHYYFRQLRELYPGAKWPESEKRLVSIIEFIVDTIDTLKNFGIKVVDISPISRII